MSNGAKTGRVKTLNPLTSRLHLNHPDLVCFASRVTLTRQRQPNIRLGQSRDEILLLSEKHVNDMIEGLVPQLCTSI
jgi:hypothetical protein